MKLMNFWKVFNSISIFLAKSKELVYFGQKLIKLYVLAKLLKTHKQLFPFTSILSLLSSLIFVQK